MKLYIWGNFIGIWNENNALLRLKQYRPKIVLISPLIAIFEEVLTNIDDKDHSHYVHPKVIRKYFSQKKNHAHWA